MTMWKSKTILIDSRRANGRSFSAPYLAEMNKHNKHRREKRKNGGRPVAIYLRAFRLIDDDKVRRKLFPLNKNVITAKNTEVE